MEKIDSVDREKPNPLISKKLSISMDATQDKIYDGAENPDAKCSKDQKTLGKLIYFLMLKKI